jgi:peptidyl-prolyl cis-trans isomerase B (cyclophilin B)
MPVAPVAVRRLLSCSAVAGLGLAMVACGSSGREVRTVAHSTTAAGKAAIVARRSGAGATARRGCSKVSAPAPKGAERIPKPTSKLDPSRGYLVSMTTNCGTIDIKLDVREAPRTTASFAYLVRRGFYDNLTFNRVAADFVIQGGDPNGDGSGGPGYTVVEPPPSSLHYTLGTVAMAKTGSDPAGASGSQFFIVTTREAALPAQYALVGNVVGSLAGVEAIAKLATDPPQDGTPRTPVVIKRATLSSG